jgi:hypothetical protein
MNKLIKILCVNEAWVGSLAFQLYRDIVSQYSRYQVT